MAKKTASIAQTVDDDLTLLADTLEAVLKSSGDPADQKYIELKMKAGQALDEVKSRISHASDCTWYRARQTVCHTDSYVRNNPWQGAGIAAAAGLVLGLLLRR
ncbi:stress response protein ElaB [Enterobacteriaceae bacterium LUAb1]